MNTEEQDILDKWKYKMMPIEELKKLLKNRPYDIIKKEYKVRDIKGNKRSFLLLKCKFDGHEWWSIESSVKRNDHGCPMCSCQIVSNKNSIKSVRPDLIKYLKNKDDADNFSYGTSKTLELICPDCGKETCMNMNRLSIKGFKCKFCYDGLSMPERFIRSILNKLDIHYETHKKFNWSLNRYYDFYIPSLNIIIETHGIQHYKNSHKNQNRTFEDECKNDILKEGLAKNNGIKNYIIIDCRYSEFEWLKNNTIEKLSNWFNLTNFDFKENYLNSQKSILIEVCKLWKERSETLKINELSKKFKIDISTIRRYLKVGTFLNLCFYDANIERAKTIIQHSTPVLQYDLNNNLIKEYISMNNASKLTNTYQQSISKCCNGLQKTANGFIWKFK